MANKVKEIKLPNNTTYDIYGKNVQNITWSDYQNLTSEQKNSDTAYFITDVPKEEMNRGIIAPIPNTPTEIATFTASELPMPFLKIGIEAVQSGTGDPSPTNVRPFTGFSAVNVYRVGDNMGNCADIPEPLTTNKWYTVNLPYDTYTISFDVVNAVRTTVGDTYVFTPYDGTTNTNILASKIYSVEDGSTYQSKGANVSGRFYFTYTGKFQSLGCFWRSNSYQILTSGSLENIMIEKGANPTKQYTPYNGTTTPIQFTVNGETKTIYSGYVEVKNGKVKAVAKTGYADLGTLSWSKSSVSGKTYFVTKNEIADAKKSSGINYIQGISCSQYKEDTWAHVLNTPGYDGYICIGWANKSYIAVNDTRYNNSTASEFKTALDGVQLVYKLATPIEYDLADVSISTLDGVNNLLADSGKILDGTYYTNPSTQLRMNDQILTNGIKATYAKYAEEVNNVKFVDWEEYESLSTEDKQSDTAYFIDNVPDSEIDGSIVANIPNTPTSITTFTASALPMPSLTVGIEAQQAGTGDPSPTNVRPFTGFSAVNVYRHGKNLVGFKDGTGSAGTNRTYTISNNTVSVTSSSNVVSSQILVGTALSGVLDIALFKAGTYKLSISNQTGFTKTIQFVFKYGDNTNVTVNDGDTFTLTSDATLVSIVFSTSVSWNTKTLSFNAQIERGETATTYEPYNGTTYTTTLKDGQGNPLTCYGGTLSNENGVQTLENILGQQNMANWNWVRESAGGGNYRFRSKSAVWSEYQRQSTIGLSSAFTINRSPIGGAKIDNTLWVHSDGLVYIYCDTYTDVDTFKEFIKDVQLFLPRITPTQITQDNLAIASQDGTNNLCADTGDVMEGKYCLPLDDMQLRVRDNVLTNGNRVAYAVSSKFADYATNVKYGTTANTACEGNDPRLSNARPSSDVVQTYSSTSTVPISGKGVATALATLDGTVSGTASAGKTLTTFSQTDGKVSATFGNISITKSQVSDLGTIGTAAAKNYTTSVTSGSADLVTSGAVYTAIDNLPEPMVFKGTLGTGGTITALPVNGTATIGDTYKVITAGTYASQVAKIGDVFICQTKTSSANTWAYVPSGDDTVADTWRNIKVNGTEKIGAGISTGAVDFVNGTNTTVNYNATGNKISIDATDTNTWRPIKFEGGGIITDNSTPLDFYQGDNISFTFGMGTDDGKMWISATDTWRAIQTNGTQQLGTATTTGALNFKDGTNTTVTYDGGVVINATDTTYESKTAASGGTDVSLVTTGEKYTWNNKVSSVNGQVGTVTILASQLGVPSNVVSAVELNSTDPNKLDIKTKSLTKSSIATTTLNLGIGDKIDKAGDTMTGSLLINYQHPELQFKTTDWTIDTTSNNGLSEDAGTGTVQMYGNDNTIIGRFNVYGNSAGATRARMQCYNKTTSGDTVTAGFGVQANKNGTVEYYVESPETLRQTCHGAYGWRQWTTAGTTYTVSNNAPAEFHYGIMMSGTTTASLFVIGGSPGSYALTLTKLTSTNLTTNFTVTLNATSGKLTVKNKSSSNISFCILGY